MGRHRNEMEAAIGIEVQNVAFFPIEAINVIKLMNYFRFLYDL